jgi:hypothetical protein
MITTPPDVFDSQQFGRTGSPDFDGLDVRKTHFDFFRRKAQTCRFGQKDRFPRQGNAPIAQHEDNKKRDHDKGEKQGQQEEDAKEPPRLFFG